MASHALRCNGIDGIDRLSFCSLMSYVPSGFGNFGRTMWTLASQTLGTQRDKGKWTPWNYGAEKPLDGPYLSLSIWSVRRIVNPASISSQSAGFKTLLLPSSVSLQCLHIFVFSIYTWPKQYSFTFRGNFTDRNHGLLCNDFACESSVVPTAAHWKARTCLPDGDDDQCATSTALMFWWPLGRWAFICLCSTQDQGSESDGVWVWVSSVLSLDSLCLVTPCGLLSEVSFLAITGQVFSLQQCLGCFGRPKMCKGRRKYINYRQSIL